MSSGDSPDGAYSSLLCRESNPLNQNGDITNQEHGPLENAGSAKGKELKMAQSSVEEVIEDLHKNDEIIKMQNTNNDLSNNVQVIEGERKSSETKETANDKQNITDETTKPDEEDSKPGRTETITDKPNMAPEGTTNVHDEQQHTIPNSANAYQEKVIIKPLENNTLNVGDQSPVEISIRQINTIVDRISNIHELNDAKDEMRSRLEHINSIIDKIGSIEELKNARNDIRSSLDNILSQYNYGF